MDVERSDKAEIDNFNNQGSQNLETSNPHGKEWKCSEKDCNEDNDGRSLNCGKHQNMIVPDNIVITTNDWKCIKCEEINCGEKEKCRKCGFKYFKMLVS